jgi:hypothetical protein
MKNFPSLSARAEMELNGCRNLELLPESGRKGHRPLIQMNQLIRNS